MFSWNRAERERMGLIGAVVNVLVALIALIILSTVTFMRFAMAEKNDLTNQLLEITMKEVKTMKIIFGIVINQAWILGVIGGSFLLYHCIAPVIVYDNSVAMRRWTKPWGLRALQFHLLASAFCVVSAITLSGLAGGILVDRIEWKMEKIVMWQHKSIWENITNEESQPAKVHLLNKIHVEFDCCQTYQYRQAQGEKVLNETDLPDSCCHPVFIEDCLNPHLNMTVLSRMYYTDGCAKPVASRLQIYGIIVTTAFALIAALKATDCLIVQLIASQTAYVEEFGASGDTKVPGSLIPFAAPVQVFPVDKLGLKLPGP